MSSDAQAEETKTAEEEETGTTTGSSSTSEDQDTSGSKDESKQYSESGTTSSEVTYPDWVKSLMQQSAQVSGEGLSDFQDMVRNYQVDPAAWGELQKTVGGDYLYGGKAQQAFIDASQRQAMPGVFSAFGGSGRGTGGLAQHAIAQSGIDAYAGLYDKERARMQGAATAIPGIQMLPFELQKDLVTMAQANPNAFASLFGKTEDYTKSGTESTQTQYEEEQKTEEEEEYEEKTKSKKKGSETTPVTKKAAWKDWAGIASSLIGAGLSPVTAGGSTAAASVFNSLLGNK